MTIAADVSSGKPAIVFAVIVGAEAHIRIYRTSSSPSILDQWWRLWWHYFGWELLFSHTQWALWTLCWEEMWKILVFSLAFCYTGFVAMMVYPCAKIMAESVEPRYQ